MKNCYNFIIFDLQIKKYISVLEELKKKMIKLSRGVLRIVRSVCETSQFIRQFFCHDRRQVERSYGEQLLVLINVFLVFGECIITTICSAMSRELVTTNRSVQFLFFDIANFADGSFSECTCFDFASTIFVVCFVIIISI